MFGQWIRRFFAWLEALVAGPEPKAPVAPPAPAGISKAEVQQMIAENGKAQVQRTYELLSLLGYDLSDVPAAYAAHVATLESAVAERTGTVNDLMMQLQEARASLATAQSAVSATAELREHVPVEVDVARYQA